ncbi:hypothetical protein Nepgr_024008 [Nepenthes gracilis]|uniref:Uncharacterized protein n=1 Tax=Nepenthes gracilis TaxID=150966 RepID=A0AAD3T3L4_NEPGR|nr:hypothetical protein Nepgr_024008 [Nepenthes gracilis]
MFSYSEGLSGPSGAPIFSVVEDGLNPSLSFINQVEDTGGIPFVDVVTGGFPLVDGNSCAKNVILPVPTARQSDDVAPGHKAMIQDSIPMFLLSPGASNSSVYVVDQLGLSQDLGRAALVAFVPCGELVNPQGLMPCLVGDDAAAHIATPEDVASKSLPISGALATPISWSAMILQNHSRGKSAAIAGVIGWGTLFPNAKWRRLTGLQVGFCRIHLPEVHPPGMVPYITKPTSKGPSTGSVQCSNTFGTLNDIVMMTNMSHDINTPDINDCIIPEARNEDHLLGDLETKETGCMTEVRSESLANLTMPLGRNNVIIGCRNDISSLMSSRKEMIGLSVCRRSWSKTRK